jgi:hypothetical protein
LAIVVEPAVFLLLFKIFGASLSGKGRDLFLFLEKSDEFYNCSIGFTVYTFKLAGTAIILEFEIF